MKQCSESSTQAFISWGHDWICGIKSHALLTLIKAGFRPTLEDPGQGQDYSLRLGFFSDSRPIELMSTDVPLAPSYFWAFYKKGNIRAQRHVRLFVDRPMEHDKAWGCLLLWQIKVHIECVTLA